MSTKARKSHINYYDRFDLIDGTHPIKEQIPESAVEYQARKRKGGKVAFFNYSLAKEMGLIDQDHPHEMNRTLEAKILDTFAIVIINEYDIENERKFPSNELKENTYMATRYLQLQHPDKTGTTSGDGRSIWNGQISNRGKTWDVSSCGTGATCLSPATAINKKFYETGDTTISYGCGYAEFVEGAAAAIMSEVFYHNKLNTERTLAVLDFGDGLSINIRTAPNLLRPSHFFNHLKQSEYDRLQRMVDYYIDREINAKRMEEKSSEKKQYDHFLECVMKDFAQSAARFESDYIFVWMDWDGDNVLMNGGIIDYGSIRQFGLFHHEYRFDDVERFSTNIKEQKYKAKYTIQTFAQLVDFLKTGEKKNIKNFANHKILKKFDVEFEKEKRRLSIKKLGLKPEYVDFLCDNKKRVVDDFLTSYNYFERYKSSEGPTKVEDGVTHNAVFCIRDLLREFPKYILDGQSFISFEEFIHILKSNYATEEDLEKTTYKNFMALKFQRRYHDLINLVAEEFDLNPKKLVLDVSKRSDIINRYERITGNSIIHVTEMLLEAKDKYGRTEFTRLIQQFVDEQIMDPEARKKAKAISRKNQNILDEIADVMAEFSEGL